MTPFQDTFEKDAMVVLNGLVLLHQLAVVWTNRLLADEVVVD